VVLLNNRYDILKELGGGGFAVTYQARDQMQPSKPFCVVKQLRSNQASDPRIVSFFEKEAATLEILGHHPQIPRLLAHFSENQAFYIVQEFIDGPDLSQELSPGVKRDEAYGLRLLQDVLPVLEFIHQNQVIHRDIKPDNLVRRTADGKVVLIDFGAVKQLASLQVNAGGQVTSTVVIGTSGYMPWEQSQGRPSPSSDLYALGMTVIQALTGLTPDQLDTDPKTLELDWQTHAQVSLALDRVLSKMVRHAPRDRYLTATDALADVNHILVGAPSGVATVRIDRPAPDSFLEESKVASAPVTRRNWLKWVGFGAAGLVSVPVLRWLFSPVGNGSGAGNGTPAPATIGSGAGTPAPNASPSLPEFTFDIVQVNERGETINTRPGRAAYFTEDLGDGIELQMVSIPGGEFVMGSPANEEGRWDNEGPQRTVTIPAFFMGRFVITQAQYQRLMGENPSRFNDNGANRPVEKVSWRDAVAFCEKLSQQTGRTYRLPSEAEWEYACRAGSTTPFHFGPTITPDLANYNGTYTYGNGPEGVYREQTTEVGSFPPNGFGLYDMHGNVWEWCADHWHNNYEGAPTDGTSWLSSDEAARRIIRGGSWLNSPRYCRSAFRNSFEPGNGFNDVGFRVVCSAPKT
jgi:eukaryotic-like serine/threonine-protein kinase